MNEIELLISILQEFKEGKFLIEPIKQKHPDILETLQNTEIIYDAPKSKSTICYECLEPHPAALKRLPIGGYGWHCPETGFHIADNINRDMGKVDKAKLIEHIRKSVGIKQSKAKFETPIDGLYDLGKLGGKAIEGNFLLYLQDEHPLSNESLNDYINLHKSHSGLNILLCLYHPLSMRVHELPKEFFVVPIINIFTFNRDTFLFLWKELNVFLPEHKQIKMPSNPIGRPSRQDLIQASFDKLSQSEEFISAKVKEQAHYIHVDIGSPKTPSINTICNHLPKMKNARN